MIAVVAEMIDLEDVSSFHFPGINVLLQPSILIFITQKNRCFKLIVVRTCFRSNLLFFKFRFVTI